MLVIFEGLDNCGKTTLVQMIKDYYLKIGIPAEISKEFETNIGKELKTMAKEGTLDPILKAYLFAADRHIRMKNITNEDLQERVMLFDRYVPSALAYRMTEGIDKNWITNINSVFPKADIGFFIDITPEESVKRNIDTKFNIKASPEHLAKVREAYLSIINENNLIYIDGMQPIQNIFDEVINNIEEYRKKMEKELESLLNELKKCEICKEKFGFQPHPIFLGNVNSKIVQISQAPSATVHETLKPFTDQSGKKLKYEWYMISDEKFYNPDNFYIAALAHCYPGKDKNGNDRMPPKICYETWIKKELEYINNKLYIIIGAKSAKVFFPKEDFNSLIFKNNKLNGKLAIVLPHPSPLNIKWFKEHPEFMEKRILEIREILSKVLEEN